jgi:hypothetical protein
MTRAQTIFVLSYIVLCVIGCCLAPGCTNTGPTNIPATVTLHVDNLNITLTMPPGSIVIPPGAVSVPINVTINGKLLTPSPASQPAKEKP